MVIVRVRLWLDYILRYELGLRLGYGHIIY